MSRLLFLLACFLIQSLGAQILWQFSNDTVVTWYYQEGDEFNGKGVDSDYWAYSLWAHSLYMNNEQQYYSEGKNHIVNNGVLTLVAKRERVNKRTVDFKG